MTSPAPSVAGASEPTPENLRLHIEAPGATRAATTAALQAAEHFLASRGITLSSCYSELASPGSEPATTRQALEAAGQAALMVLQGRDAPRPALPCLVLVASE